MAVATMSRPKSSGTVKVVKASTKGKGQKNNAHKVVKKTTTKPKASAEKREYGLSADEVKALRAETPKGKIPAPYRINSTYGMLFAVISSHPIGKPIAAETIVEKVQKLGDKSFWTAFKNKPNRNEETGKDWKSRLIQSAIVLCRKKDYGKPIVDIGYSLSTKVENGKRTFTLAK